MNSVASIAAGIERRYLDVSCDLDDDPWRNGKSFSLINGGDFGLAVSTVCGALRISVADGAVRTYSERGAIRRTRYCGT